MLFIVLAVLAILLICTIICAVIRAAFRLALLAMPVLAVIGLIAVIRFLL